MTETPTFYATEGIHNFRDYGGYPTQGGGRVQTGVLFRSGQHFEASEADLRTFADLGIRTVIDLRGNAERERHPCRRPDMWDGEVVFYDGETSSRPPHEPDEPIKLTAESAHGRMLKVYSRMPHNAAMQTIFGQYLNALAQRDGASLVHCFAGKDRTGIAAALLHHILGVSRADMLTEFLHTNDAPTYDILERQSLPGIEARLGGPLDRAAVKELMEVREAYFHRFVEVVDEGWGSLDSFLGQAIGVDDALRERLNQRFVV
ncbi:tyrosine-protein phosphatase [Alteriqipengyuania lutimaris]|uniref:Protein-tyrosine-phosphatase n=1 Tax=Alteriqipengyuania lutimaris TaxID=1538146 RepID=A0A395LS15_9SPHN|nr:tyrosine-protein phosphatase [Alteriqipengyuania lutimaris]MBB3032618.1 protein tyrosine/serine phosphatase [Alteriqipengyuania lutimaris]RDS78264.1 protein-tyrosine-phosphatase [Alteriqipengyuania lutimaris]